MTEPAHSYVESLPDLIDAEEYGQQPAGEVLGDAFRPVTLEAVLAALGPDTIEQMLCG
jgi:hypothetical protein